MYGNMKKIYLSNQVMFCMAVANLLDMGFRRIENLTDEDIAKVEGNGFMTKDFAQDLMRMSRDIARECGNDVIEIIQFCQKAKVFDTKFYK